MQREIKFRVWSKVKNGWVHNMMLLACIDGLPFAHLVEYNEKNEFVKHHIYNASNLDVTIQQYTGLKDSKGREIYEGDIISNLDGVDYVYYKNGCFWVDDQWLYDHASNNEIIGNIFENPELLKV